MWTTLQAVSLATSRLQRTTSSIAERTDVARELAYFRSRIGSVSSAEALVSDQRLLTVVTEAFGLSDLGRAKGLIRKVLLDGTTSGGTADRMIDQRFRDLAAAFDFKRYGADATKRDVVVDGIPARFIRQRVERAAGQDNDAVRLALYFDRKAGDIRSPYGILADKALMQVVSTAIGLPDAFRTLDIDRQAEQLRTRIDVRTWSDPALRKAFIEKFAVRWDLEGRGERGATSTVALSSSSQARFTDKLLLSLQAAKLAR